MVAGISSSLAACGGGGGSGKVASYNQLLQAGKKITAEYRAKEEAGEQVLTPVDAMQTSGRATYTGFGSVSVKEDPNKTGSGVLVSKTTDKDGHTVYEYEPQLIGVANLTADFDKKSLEGSVGNFQARKGHATNGGEIRYSGNIAGNETHGRFTGKVNLNDKDHAIKIDGEGVFLGDESQHIAVSGDDNPSGFDETLSVDIIGTKN